MLNASWDSGTRGHFWSGPEGSRRCGVFWTRPLRGIYWRFSSCWRRSVPDAGAVARVFGRLWEGLALEEERLLPDAWQSHLVGRVLDDENPFSLEAEKGEISTSVLGAGTAGSAHAQGDVRAGRGCVARQGRVCRSCPGRHLGPLDESRARGATLRGARSRASSRRRRTGERAQSFWPATTPGMEPDPTAATGHSSGEKGDSWPSLVLTP